MRILCISDVHGNHDALAAVLVATAQRRIAKVLVAGDLVFPGPQPLETWKTLVRSSAIMVQGLADKAVATLDPNRLRASTDEERARVERLREVRAELGDVILERLRRLPSTYRMALEDGGELVLVHGSPADPAEPMEHDMTDEELLARVGGDPADLVICGMTHVPFDRTVGDVRVVGVGSVGEAPDDEAYAHGVILETTRAGVLVEPLAVRIVVPGSASAS